MDRFMKFVDKRGPLHPVLKTRCWQWTGGMRGNGYGQFWYKGTNRKASRVSYILFITSFDERLFVLHDCDNRKCVNPAHLKLGTHQDNMSDMLLKNRQASGDKNGSRLYPERLMRGNDHINRIDPTRVQGERNGRAKLNRKDIRRIRKLSNKGVNRSKLSREYGVSRTIIRLVHLRKLWKCVK